MSDATTDDGSGSGGEQYVVRPFRTGDAAAVRALNELVWGKSVGEDWLVHHFADTPYLDGPSLTVAAHDDEGVVGARPFVAFPARVDGTDALGLHLTDLMVHPDHRRNGLFTRMTTRIVEEYADVAAFTLNFANEQSAPGYRKMGFAELGVGPDLPMRVQRPGRFVRERLPDPVGRLAGAAATTAAAGFLRARRIPHALRTDYRVERVPGIPGDRLTALYESAPPERLHLRREPRFYAWLADHPGYTHRTYVALADGEPAAAVVVQDRAASDPGVRFLVDAVPLPNAGRDDAVSAALDAALFDGGDADVVRTASPMYERLLSPTVRSRFGFYASSHPLLSRFTSSTETVFVRRLGAADSRLGGRDLRDPANWLVPVR